MKLGNRLAAIAAMVQAGSRIADIGTDHAFIPIYLVTHGISTFAVAGDVHQGPYRSALDTISRMNLGENIAIRFGNGFEVLSPGEVDTAIIAGMGGANIIDILSSRPEITGRLTRLILQPMLAAAAVRRWLTENGWRLVDETLVEDEGRIYEIIMAEPGETVAIEPILYDIGPVLWAKRPPLLKPHVASITTQLKRVAAEMAGSTQAVNSPKYREYCEKIVQLEEKYACL